MRRNALLWHLASRHTDDGTRAIPYEHSRKTTPSHLQHNRKVHGATVWQPFQPPTPAVPAPQDQNLLAEDRARKRAMEDELRDPKNFVEYFLPRPLRLVFFGFSAASCLIACLINVARLAQDPAELLQPGSAGATNLTINLLGLITFASLFVYDQAAAEQRVERRRRVREAQIAFGDREVFVNEDGERMSRLKEVNDDWVLRRLERWGRCVHYHYMQLLGKLIPVGLVPASSANMSSTNMSSPQRVTTSTCLTSTCHHLHLPSPRRVTTSTVPHLIVSPPQRARNVSTRPVSSSQEGWDAVCGPQERSPAAGTGEAAHPTPSGGSGHPVWVLCHFDGAGTLHGALPPALTCPCRRSHLVAS